MKSTQFPSQNTVLGPPKGMVNCDPLAVRKNSELGTYMSVWKPSPEELAMLNRGGYVLLWIFGDVHPPVAVTTHPELP